MYCRKCGAQIEDEAYMCVHCGTLAREIPDTVQAEETESRNGCYEKRGLPYRKTNGMAIAGFICSLFFALLGLIFSSIGLNQCKKRGEDGRGLALAGVIISSVWIGVILIYLLAAEAVAIF